MSRTISINDKLIERMNAHRPKTEHGQLSYSDVIEKAMDALEHPPTVITKIPGEGVEITEQKK